MLTVGSCSKLWLRSAQKARPIAQVIHTPHTHRSYVCQIFCDLSSIRFSACPIVASFPSPISHAPLTVINWKQTKNFEDEHHCDRWMTHDSYPRDYTPHICGSIWNTLFESIFIFKLDKICRTPFIAQYALHSCERPELRAWKRNTQHGHLC